MSSSVSDNPVAPASSSPENLRIETAELEILDTPLRRYSLARIDVQNGLKWEDILPNICRFLAGNKMVASGELLAARLAPETINSHTGFFVDEPSGKYLMIHIHPYQTSVRNNIANFLAPDQDGLLCLVISKGEIPIGLAEWNIFDPSVRSSGSAAPLDSSLSVLCSVAILSIHRMAKCPMPPPLAWLIHNHHLLTVSGHQGFPSRLVERASRITRSEFERPLPSKALSSIPYPWDNQVPAPVNVLEQDRIIHSRATNSIRRRELRVENIWGFHSRSVAKIVKCCAKYSSHIFAERNGIKVSAKQIMDLLTLEAYWGAIVSFTAEGPDADAALDALAELFAKKFDED